MREIVISGDIDNDLFLRFHEELSELEAASTKDVLVILNSQGGCAEDALAISSRMRRSECHINVTVYGACYSAAVLILAAGERRSMTSESWVMVHEEQGTSKGSVANREKDIAHYRRLENQWNGLMEFYTGTKAEKWADLHKTESYLSANQCKELNLIQEII